MNPPKSRPPAQREIARRAGVSNATVSFVLNNDPRISMPTRKKVLKVVRELGYTPKVAVARLMAEIRRTRPDKPVIALVTNWASASPWKTHPYMRRFYEAVTQRAQEVGYEIQELWMGAPGNTAKRLSRILKARNISGLIIPPGFNAGKRLPFDVSDVAVVSHGRMSWRPELNRVESDHHYNIMLALKELRKLGYERIGLVCLGGVSWIHGHQIESAYAYYQSRGLIAGGIPPLVQDDYTADQRFFDWLKAHRLECVLSTYPDMVNWLRRQNIAVPKQMGFACLGVIPELGNCAGIDIRSELLDAALVDMVVAQIALGERGAPNAPRATIIEGFWQPGGTVKRQKRNRKNILPPDIELVS
jgi:DNA-binding LacI/PurR family transcriptional regulator